MTNNPNVPPPPGPGGYSQQGGMPGRPLEYPQGTTILVLGILSIICCSFLGPVAWYMGNNARKEINNSPNTYSNASLVTIGWVCGIIGTVALAASIVYAVIVIGAGA